MVGTLTYGTRGRSPTSSTDPADSTNDVAVELEYESDALGRLLCPSRHTTYAWDGRLSSEIGGVFGRPLAALGAVFSSGNPWPLEGLRGLEQDRRPGLAHAGTRHFRSTDGIWLQGDPSTKHGGRLALNL